MDLRRKVHGECWQTWVLGLGGAWYAVFIGAVACTTRPVAPPNPVLSPPVAEISENPWSEAERLSASVPNSTLMVGHGASMLPLYPSGTPRAPSPAMGSSARRHDSGLLQGARHTVCHGRACAQGEGRSVVGDPGVEHRPTRRCGGDAGKLYRHGGGGLPPRHAREPAGRGAGPVVQLSTGHVPHALPCGRAWQAAGVARAQQAGDNAIVGRESGADGRRLRAWLIVNVRKCNPFL